MSEIELNFNMMGFPVANSNMEMVQEIRLISPFQNMVTERWSQFCRQLYLICLRVLLQRYYLMWLIWDAFEWMRM